MQYKLLSYKSFYTENILPSARLREIKPVKPLLYVLAADPRAEAHTFLPVAGIRRFRKQLSALTKSGARRGAERDNGFAGKVVGFYKIVNRPGGDTPPNRVIKCSPSSPALENTGLNGLHKCVFCSFLVAYCSDLSHLLYSASPVYTNTYV